MSEPLDYSGQRDYYDPVRHAGSVMVVGAGGIGSPTIMGLARLGVPKINVYDDDIVEPRNVTCQNFTKNDIDKSKAYAIANLARQVCDGEINSFESRVSDDTPFSGNIVVSAVDSMESRKSIYEAASKSPSVTHLIDGRLGGELIVCHSINIRDNDQVEYYLSDEVMFPDSEMESNICTARAVCDVGFAVAALIIRAVRKILTGEEVERLQMLHMGKLELTKF